MVSVLFPLQQNSTVPNGKDHWKKKEEIRDQIKLPLYVPAILCMLFCRNDTEKLHTYKDVQKLDKKKMAKMCVRLIWVAS